MGLLSSGFRLQKCIRGVRVLRLCKDALYVEVNFSASLSA